MISKLHGALTDSCRIATTAISKISTALCWSLLLLGLFPVQRLFFCFCLFFFCFFFQAELVLLCFHSKSLVQLVYGIQPAVVWRLQRRPTLIQANIQKPVEMHLKAAKRGMEERRSIITKWSGEHREQNMSNHLKGDFYERNQYVSNPTSARRFTHAATEE